MYLRTKFQVSSIILTSFRQGVILPSSLSPPQNESPKRQIRVKTTRTWTTCGPFTKHCERIQKFRETGNLKHLYRNELDTSDLAAKKDFIALKAEVDKLNVKIIICAKKNYIWNPSTCICENSK